MAPVADSDISFAGALNIVAAEIAQTQGTLPSAMQRGLLEALHDVGIDVPDPKDWDDAIRARAIAAVREQVAADTDPDAAALRAQIDAAAARTQPSPMLAVETVAVGGAVIVILAILGKIEYRDGKWIIHPGLPGIEKLKDILPTIFS